MQFAAQNHTSANPDEKEKNHLYAWQKRLLPFMVIVPSVLAAVFIWIATVQMMKFNTLLDTKPDPSFIGKMIPNPTDPGTDGNLRNNLAYYRWLTLTHLEQESLYRRYNQGGLLLMSRIFTKYLGFFTGMILAIVGAVFIIGKLSEDSTQMSGKTGQLSFSLASSSPGIIFAFLGTILMITTILQHSEITIQDSPLYLSAPGIQSIGRQVEGDTVARAGTTERIDPAAIESLFQDKQPEGK